MDTVTRVLLDEIRSEGYKIKTALVVDEELGVERYRFRATDPRTGEPSEASAPDAYDAAYELAVMLEWDLAD